MAVPATSQLTIVEHAIPAQYIRECHRGAKSDSSELRLAVKEYRPTNQLIADDSISIVATHAYGIAKEAYEPLWQDLCKVFPGKIRAIWFADCTHQGASAQLNEGLLGDDHLLALVNHFRHEMPRPIVGIGHSMGFAQLVQLALLHPRLLDGLALIEPVIRPTPPPGPNAALPSSYRPDHWTSLAEAGLSFRKNKFFQSWDPRCLNAYLQHGLGELPPSTAMPQQGAVTLATSKAQEAWSYIRPKFAPASGSEAESLISERRRAPDLPTVNRIYQFDKAEMIQTHENLPSVRPGIFWVFADRSFINSKSENEDKLARSGTGVGGSGGVAEGVVEAVTVAKSTHMLPLEKPSECADVLRMWLTESLRRFNANEELWARYDTSKSNPDLTLSKSWMKHVKQKEHTPRDVFKGKL